LKRLSFLSSLLSRLFRRAQATDNSVAINGDANHATIIIGNGDAAALLREYLRAVSGECARLPLAAVHLKFADPQAQIKLLDVYTDLHVVSAALEDDGDAQRLGLRLARGEGERLEVIAALGKTRLAVLLGEAGSGKSTLVNYLGWQLAQAELQQKASGLHETLERRIPLRLALREVADGDGGAGLLWGALRREMQRCLRDEKAGARLFEAMQETLRDTGLFLLDGLDEVAVAGGRRQRLLQAAAALAAELRPGARLLVTARPYAYADPAARLAGFTVLALAPLDQAQADNFIHHWYTAMRPLLGMDETSARQRAEALARELRARPDLADLASRPLLLTLTAALHTYRAELPEDRADLYEESARLLLYRWQQRLERNPPAAFSITPRKCGTIRFTGMASAPMAAALPPARWRTRLTRLLARLTASRKNSRRPPSPPSVPAGLGW
jgi:predicted NACHT family NTPase